MTIDIYLIRHGEAAAAWGEDPDPGLSPLGRQQAQAVRDELEMSRELVLISSPLLRAQETAQPLAAALRSSVRIDPRFRELPSPVGMENRQAWLQQFMKQEWREQSDEILAWRETAWNHLFEVEKPTAIFSHFVMINAICSLLTDQPETVCCVPDNGSIMHVRQEGSALKLVSVGRQMPTKVN
jgi:broad specificity phosphatase PhoE